MEEYSLDILHDWFILFWTFIAGLNT